MKRAIAILIALPFAIIAGCSRQEEYKSEDTLCVSVPQSTKVHMEGLKTCWDEGDMVTVFYKSSVPELWSFMGKTGDVSGQIAHDVISRQVTGNDIYVIYPADADAVLEDNTVHTEIPSVQQYRKESYGTALLAAHSDFEVLTMKYCTAVMELKYAGPAEISHIVLSGADDEKISGQCAVSFDGSRPAVSCNGETSATLECDVDIENGQTESFCFSIAPGTFSQGVEFMVYFTNGQTHKVVVSEEISVAAGHVHTVQARSPLCQFEQKVMHLLFTDGTQQCHPFTKSISFVRDTRKEYMYVLDDVEYPFYLYCQSNENYDFRNTSKGGLYIGGTEGDYIEFPAVPGYRLHSMEVSMNKESYFHIVPTGSDEETVEGGSCTEMLEYVFRRFVLEGTEAGKSYTMMLDNNSVFRFITLYYRQ